MKRVLLCLLTTGALFYLLKTLNYPENGELVNSKANLTAKMDGAKMFEQIMHELRTREGAEGPDYQEGYQLKELKKARLHAANSSNARKGLNEIVFQERGPANVPGRTRGILIYPGDETHNTWFAGSTGGGIWKTTDAGTTWKNMTPNFPNLATSTLAMSESNMNIIYAGTGDGFGTNAGISGAGIFKSTDAGQTWIQLSTHTEGRGMGPINRMVVDPSNPDILVAAFGYNESGLSTVRKSEDGGNSWTTTYENVRRIQDLKADPADFNIQYIGINGVGVGKSTDGGDNWALSNTGMSPVGRVEVCISPVDPNRLYATVEGTVSGVFSDLYASLDAGLSWTTVQTAVQAIDFLGGQGWFNNTCLSHPFDENTVYIGGVDLFKVSIGEIIKGAQIVSDVDRGGTVDFLNLVGFGGEYYNGRIGVSDDRENRSYVSVALRFGPERSQKAHRFTVPEGSPSNVPNDAYEYQDYVDVPFEVWDIDNNRQLMISFRDEMRDGTFSPTVSAVSELIFISQETYNPSEPSNNIGKDGGQVANDLYLLFPNLRSESVADPATWPTSELVINWTYTPQYEGSTTIMTDAYNQYDGTNNFSVIHPDHHDLYTIIDNNDEQKFRILNGSDGGVYSSGSGTDPGIEEGDWIGSGNGYNTSQFYGADKAPGEDRYFGGMQDNGTWISGVNPDETAAYSFAIGGDGFESIWNNQDPNKLLGGAQFNNLAKSIDGGKTFFQVRFPVNDFGGGPFVTRIANSKQRPDIIYIVDEIGVGRSPDFGSNWTRPTMNGTEWAFSNAGLQPEVSAADPEIVWAGAAITPSNRLFVSVDDGHTFNPTNNYAEVLLGTISGLATHPVEPETAYALFSFAGTPKILKTTDLGQSWTDISGFGQNNESSTGFPDVAVYCLLVMPHNPDQIWVGTEIGIVESLDGGESWMLIGADFPAVSVWQMLIQDDEVVISTHGRGIWTATIDELPGTIIAPVLEDIGQSPQMELTVRANFLHNFDEVEILVNDVVAAVHQNVPIGNQALSAGTIEAGFKKVRVRGKVGQATSLSNTMASDFGNVPEAISYYENDFNKNTVDFSNSSDELDLVLAADGFADGGIHSKHNYSDGINATFRLKAPVVVAESNALLHYDDVAIVAPGQPGSKFGEDDFSDYVVVEGSKDGVTWLPLEDGYDATFNETWTDTFERDLSPGDENMISHTIDLLNTFDAGDKVFIRFRIFSDGQINGWGWAIDNLSIQPGNVTGFGPELLNNDISMKTYPNPALDKLTVEFQISHGNEVRIELIDLSGQVVLRQNPGRVQQGRHVFELNRNSLESGVYLLRLRTAHGTKSTRVEFY